MCTILIMILIILLIWIFLWFNKRMQGQLSHYLGLGMTFLFYILCESVLE